MIDTHCHLLPGIDDGPREMTQALELAAGLARVGVRRVICTPHFSRRYPTSYERAVAQLEALALHLREAGIGLELGLGAELNAAMALEAPDAELRRRRIAPRHVLVELTRETPGTAVELICDRLERLGLAPVLAHPERSPAVRDQPHLLDAARDRGALIQVVAPSLAGEPGSGRARAAWRLLRSGRVDLLASDSHRPAHAERLRSVLELIRRELGEATLAELTDLNAQRMLAAEEGTE
jgi:protein-tyrosine phosphatase